MNPEIKEELQHLMHCFPEAFINCNNELVFHPQINYSFILDDCHNHRDVKAKVLMWFSRPCCKLIVYKRPKQNDNFHKKMTSMLSEYLGVGLTVEQVMVIYQYLGNGINKDLTYKFIDSGYDFKVLEVK
ncbi:MAG: hypothetical protein HXL41_06815 [Solobacterium sp.]|nr:hypothetical protein [Solobacterium sp.]